MAQQQGDAAGDDALRADLVARATPLAAEYDLDLIEVELRGSRGRRVVRVVVDGDDGVDVDHCAAISRALGESLEANDPFEGAYTLEVTSPGATRPLLVERDFRRNIGRNVVVERSGQPPLTGTVEDVDATTLTLDVEGENVAVALSDIEHGKVLLPW